MKSFFRKLLTSFIYYFYKVLSSTWRIERHIHPETATLVESKSPLIFAHWHGDELTLLTQIRHFKIATMTSKSKDGELINSVLLKLGALTSRGSSSRGAISGLKGLVRLCKMGHPISFAVDGPRGPLHKVKPGVFELSKISQAKVIPVGAEASKRFVFEKSWNKTFLPLPFSKVAIVYGPPLTAISKNTDPRNPTHLQSLEAALSFTKDEALKFV